MTKSKKTDINNEDAAAFNKAMQGVKPLTHTKIPLAKTGKTDRVAPKINDESPSGFQFSDYDRLDSVKSDDYIEFSRSGVQHKVLRKMRQGHYNTDAILDLHGKTSDEARESLSQFLLQCRKQGLRYLLIIHGKGRDSRTPVLKNKLNNWLRQTEQVIAFCTAAYKHGGSGALYVLLRRQN